MEGDSRTTSSHDQRRDGCDGDRPGTADHQIAEIARFCEDLVDVNRLRWDAMSLALIETTVHDIVEAAVDSASSRIREQGHSLTAASRNGSVEFVVEDSDRGSGPQTLPYIFDLFARGTRGEPTDGFGIGLALVRPVAVLHGGEVDAHSDGPGKASRFIASPRRLHYGLEAFIACH